MKKKNSLDLMLCLLLLLLLLMIATGSAATTVWHRLRIVLGAQQI